MWLKNAKFSQQSISNVELVRAALAPKAQGGLHSWPGFSLNALEKEMATHSRVLAWRIPGMGEPGGLPSMGSHRVGHD